jgi:hypothetical protein
MEKIKKIIIDFLSEDVNVFLVTILLVGTIFSGGNYFNWFVAISTMYAIMNNNCIQTLGFFIASNKNSNKLVIWLFFSAIFILTMLISWFIYDGEIHYDLLSLIKYNKNTSILIILVPILLNLLTKYGIPVSATFLIIPLFGTKNLIHSMIVKTSVSYFLSFVISFSIWYNVYKKYKTFIREDKKINKMWNAGLYALTGMLWFAWSVMSICNFVIFIDRKFSIYQLILFSGISACLMFIVLSKNNGNINKIVEEKIDAGNIKSTTIFNFIFSFMLLYLQFFSKVPLTTTWVFLGLISGRELSIAYTNDNFFSGKNIKTSLEKIVKDLCKAVIGIVCSLIFVKLILLIMNIF